MTEAKPARDEAHELRMRLLVELEGLASRLANATVLARRMVNQHEATLELEWMACGLDAIKQLLEEQNT